MRVWRLFLMCGGPLLLTVMNIAQQNVQAVIASSLCVLAGWCLARAQDQIDNLIDYANELFYKLYPGSKH